MDFSSEKLRPDHTFSEGRELVLTDGFPLKEAANRGGADSKNPGATYTSAFCQGMTSLHF